LLISTQDTKEKEGAMNYQDPDQELNPQAASPQPEAQETPKPQGQPDAISGEYERPPRRGDPDVELWKGGYSMRAMAATWMLLGLITIVVLALDVWIVRNFLKEGQALLWEITLGILALVWIYFILVGLYKAMTIRYRLTTYRFYHQKGLLFRTIDSMEVIDIEDLALHQNLLERLVNVGRVLMRTKDISDPILMVTGITDPHEAFKRIDKARRDEHVRRSIKIG
jgi:membrane protein YdbS with pleckstrin-like domain